MTQLIKPSRAGLPVAHGVLAQPEWTLAAESVPTRTTATG